MSNPDDTPQDIPHPSNILMRTVGMREFRHDITNVIKELPVCVLRRDVPILTVFRGYVDISKGKDGEVTPEMLDRAYKDAPMSSLLPLTREETLHKLSIAMQACDKRDANMICKLAKELAGYEGWYAPTRVESVDISYSYIESIETNTLRRQLERAHSQIAQLERQLERAHSQIAQRERLLDTANHAHEQIALEGGDHNGSEEGSFSTP